jgi:acylphosphatase
MDKQLHAIIAGRVQLVMYRDFTKRNARILGLTGRVKNLPDGTVEVIAEGPEAALEKLVELLRKGSLLAQVERVEQQWLPKTDLFSTFEIDYGK